MPKSISSRAPDTVCPHCSKLYMGVRGLSIHARGCDARITQVREREENRIAALTLLVSGLNIASATPAVPNKPTAYVAPVIQRPCTSCGKTVHSIHTLRREYPAYNYTPISLLEGRKGMAEDSRLGSRFSRCVYYVHHDCFARARDISKLHAPLCNDNMCNLSSSNQFE